MTQTFADPLRTDTTPRTDMPPRADISPRARSLSVQVVSITGYLIGVKEEIFRQQFSVLQYYLLAAIRHLSETGYQF